MPHDPSTLEENNASRSALAVVYRIIDGLDL